YCSTRVLEAHAGNKIWLFAYYSFTANLLSLLVRVRNYPVSREQAGRDFAGVGDRDCVGKNIAVTLRRRLRGHVRGFYRHLYAVFLIFHAKARSCAHRNCAVVLTLLHALTAGLATNAKEFAYATGQAYRRKFPAP